MPGCSHPRQIFDPAAFVTYTSIPPRGLRGCHEYDACAPTGFAAAAFDDRSAAKTVKTWLVGPWFDLLFLANFAWPVAVLLALLRPLDESNPLSLFQVYFLSTPHRWITLVLVFCDSDRFWKEPGSSAASRSAWCCWGWGLSPSRDCCRSPPIRSCC